MPVCTSLDIDKFSYDLNFLRQHQVVPPYDPDTGVGKSLFVTGTFPDEVECLYATILDNVICSFGPICRPAALHDYKPNPTIVSWADSGFYVVLQDVDSLCEHVNAPMLSYALVHRIGTLDLKSFMCRLLARAHCTKSLQHADNSGLLEILNRLVNCYLEFGMIFVLDQHYEPSSDF